MRIITYCRMFSSKIDPLIIIILITIPKPCLYYYNNYNTCSYVLTFYFLSASIIANRLYTNQKGEIHVLYN